MLDGFEKIDLTSQSSNAPEQEQETIAMERASSKGLKKKIAFPLVATVIVGVLILAMLFLAQQVYFSSVGTFHQAKKALDAIKSQDLTQIEVELGKTKIELAKTQKSLAVLSFLRFIPLLGSYYSDADHLGKAASHTLAIATIFVDSLKPYADVLGLKGEGSFVGGSAEQRIQTVVLTMGKITPRIDEVAKYATFIQGEIDAINPNRYPTFLVGNIHKQLVTVREITDSGVALVNEARPLVKVLPALLGESKEKRYLVLFQNDKELRATGGFLTAYAVFRIDKGIIHVDSSDDIYALDNSLKKRQKAPEPILKYLPKVTTFNLRDSNLSPDFVASMKTFNTLYQDTTRKVAIDGIIALDTHVLVSVIKLLDDEVYAAGIKFHTKEDERCDCPQVIYELEDRISRPIGYERSGRKDLIGVLLYAIMEKALQSSPKKYWGPLFQQFLTEVSEKHVLFYLFDTEAQKGIEALHAAGRIRQFEGDYLHVNNTNFAGAKANLYTKETVGQDILLGEDGTITKTVTLTYKNPYPPSNCDLEAGQLCLNAPLRNFLRIYVPKGSALVKSQGSEVKVTSYEELGKTVFEGFFTVKPQGQAVFTITYTLPFKLKKGSVLPLLIQKQPGTDANEYIVRVNGRQVHKFPLRRDLELVVKQ